MLTKTPPAAVAHFVFAHGAGAGMRHSFMEAMAAAFFLAHVATSRYEFDYMAQGRRRPDPPAVLLRAVRQAVQEAAELGEGVPLFAGGKSMGGRMTAYAQAKAPLPHVQGLIFVGFPLHPAGNISRDRAAPLFDVEIPMLFLQGERDKLAHMPLMREVCADLGSRATLLEVPHADHGFGIPKKVAKTNDACLSAMARATAQWCERVTA